MTGQDVIDRVRDLIKDTDSSNYRWTDADMMRWLSDAIRMLVARSPEAAYKTAVSADTYEAVSDVTDLSATLSVLDVYRPLLTDAVLIRALERDGEDQGNLVQIQHYMGRL